MKIFEIVQNKPKNFSDNKLIEFIERNCSDCLKDYRKTHRILYRGLRRVDDNIFVGTSPINRKSVDLPMLIQNIFDDKFKQLHFDARRSNSIFCVPSAWTANKYGNAYMIFPINGFKFTWSPKVWDLYNYIGGLENASKEVVKDTIMITKSMSLKEFQKEFKFINENFSKALKTSNEIYIHGKYLALNYYKYDDFANKLIQGILE